MFSRSWRAVILPGIRLHARLATVEACARFMPSSSSSSSGRVGSAARAKSVATAYRTTTATTTNAVDSATTTRYWKSMGRPKFVKADRYTRERPLGKAAPPIPSCRGSPITTIINDSAAGVLLLPVRVGRRDWPTAASASTVAVGACLAPPVAPPIRRRWLRCRCRRLVVVVRSPLTCVRTHARSFKHETTIEIKMPNIDHGAYPPPTAVSIAR